jgi:NAD(P)-dependent dehydrogenase (short-subunit alcohol dehydrogenase family)
MTDNCKRLEGKVALITGGASGIGKGTAARFVKEGARVMLVDISEENLASVKTELGGACETMVVDVTVEEQVEASVKATVEKFGKLDIVVNSAGIGALALVVDTDGDDWDNVFRVDVKGPMLFMKHGGKQMIAQGNGGAFVNIASLNSRQGAEGMSPYCSAKAALEMLTKVAAMEMGPHNIRVNAISPGYTETPMTNPLTGMPGIVEGFLENCPIARAGTPEDIAAAALFLASDEAGWITAENLLVDGGAVTKKYPNLYKIVMGL